MRARETSLFWPFDYACLDYLHFVSRGAGVAAAEGQRASRADHRDVNGEGGICGIATRICPAKHWHDGDGYSRSVGSVAWHRISPRGGWYQPDAAAVDWYCGDCRHFVLVEHRAPRERVFRLLSGTHRWRIWRVFELRFVSAVCFLRIRHHP